MSAVPSALTRLQATFAQQGDAALLVRQQAFAQFLQRGFPTPRDELWKYTNLRRLEAREFALGRADAPIDLSSYTAQPLAHQLTFVDGWFRAELSTVPNLPGLRIASFKQLSSTELEQTLAIPNEDHGQLSALNTALAQDGALIEIAANTAIATPISLSFIWSDQQQSLMANPRLVVRAGAHSQVCLVEQYQGQGAIAHFNNALTQLQLAEGARVEHCRIQNENTQSFHLGLLHAELGAQSTLTSHQINFGAALARVEINVFLNGANANVNLNGLQFATGAQHHDTHTRVEHSVPHTASREDYRGIADQRGRVVFNGKVVVREKAVKTDAQQSSRNLLLASTAEIDTKPELEIYNDDVKCAHGATVGQLDANALFYLRSRGLDAEQARALLTHAFADHIVAQLPVAALREQLTAASHGRFGAKAQLQS